MLKLKIHTKTIIFLIFFQIIFGIMSLHAQNACSDSLKHAIDMYDEGLYEKVFEFLPKTIENCKYKGSEKEQAYKYLISSAYESDEIEYADSAIQKFLKKRPNYIKQPNDPQAFANSLNRFKIRPLFSVGLKGGVAKVDVNIIKKYNIYDEANYTAEYSETYSPMINAFMKFHFSKQISINTGLNFSDKEFKRNIYVNDSLEIGYTESFKEMVIPIILEYTPFEYYNFAPSIYAGIYTVYYQSPEGDFSESNVISRYNSLVNTSIKLEEYRNTVNYGTIFGASLNYKVKSFVFFADYTYSLDKLNYTKRNYNVITKNNVSLFFADDILKLKSSNITLGFYYTIFNKIKKKW